MVPLSDLAEQHGPHLLHLIAHVLPWNLRHLGYEPADILQEVWVSAAARLRSAELPLAPAEARAYLDRAAVNRIRDLLRKHRQGMQARLAESGPVEGLAASADHRQRAHAATAAEMAEVHEAWERRFAELCTRDFIISVLHMEGHTYQEIAGLTGVSPRTVRRVVLHVCRLTAGPGEE
jgi:RNA polymerase sigma factor (sigma-70 family)